jgi:hypothetical protein
MERIFGMAVASVYPLYVAKVERKGRTKADVDEGWLTGFTQDEIDAHVASGTSFRDFFAGCDLQPEGCAHHGCDLRCQGAGDHGSADAADPLSRQTRRRGRARGKAMEKILRA